MKKDHNKDIKVSVIVPVYNVEKYLNNCIDSILDQTYENFELILIDDGSTDRSGAICDQYVQFDKRIKVLHQINQGQSKARNAGVNLAKTEWILFVDSDDLIHPQMIEFLVRAVKESNSNMSVCGRLQKETIPDDFYRQREYKYEGVIINESSLCKMYQSTESAFLCAYWLIYPKLIKKSIVQKIPFAEGKIFEDNEVSCKWLVEAQRVAVLKENMYFYTCNPTGTMNSKFSLKKLDYLWALESKIEFYKSIHYDKMMRLISEELLESAFYYYNLSIENKKIEKVIKNKIKKIVYKYEPYICFDERKKRKLEKILHPFLFKVKKKLS